MLDDYPPTPSSSRLRAIPQLLTPARGSKAADIAHLLDPSYSPTRTDTYLNQIYVDHAGEAHDPDFRLFAPAAYSPKRREFLTCGDSDGDSDGDYDADADVYHDAVPASASSYPSPKRASLDAARPASRPASRASDADAAAAYAGTFSYTYTFAAHGYLSDDEPRREANKLRRRRASLEPERPEHPAEPHPSPSPPPPPRAEWSACTPSATAIRRQWHALRLRTQVAAFRARKRVTRIVSPSAG